VRRRKDGREIEVSVTASPIRDAAGRITGIAKVARDITELARAKAAADAANLELEAFSYSVAHDLRAPLRGIRSFAEMLVEDYRERLDAQGQDWLDEIGRSAQRMGELIDALLSLSKVSRRVVHCETIDLAALVRETAAALAAADPERVVTWIVPDELHAALDPVLARALFANLLGNAWKFTAHTAAPVIEVGRLEAGGFVVRDNGAGFAMTYAHKLFAPFQRLHSATEFAGTGIGLAIVHRIVSRHGGRIWAEGAVGKGAAFFVTIPEGKP
jgi:light-regulated signal transduction histidine kinase (bacteriophytochrome)